jgi:UDP-glucose 4-epimerase
MGKIRMKILITGGAGFIGSHLIDSLVKKQNELIVLDNFSTSSITNIRTYVNSLQVKIISGSILDFNLIKECMKGVSYCYHLAAHVGVQNILVDPINALEVNIKGSENVIKAAAELGIRTLVTSSSEIYGKQTVMPLREDSDRILGQTGISRWSYSEAKAIDELYALELHKKSQFPVTIARLFNTVGTRQSGSYGMVLPRFIHAAKNNLPLFVYNEGTQSRTFCAVQDVVYALNLLIDSNETIGEVYNVGSRDEITILELAKLIIKLTNSKSKINFKSTKEVYGSGFEEPMRRIPNIDKIATAVGWTPKKNLSQIIFDIYEYLDNQ